MNCTTRLRYTPGTEDLMVGRDGSDGFGRRITKVEPRDESKAGVYFAGAAGANLVKIGWVLRAHQFDARLARLQTDCPYPVILLHLIVPATRVQEQRIHKLFLAHHFHGEWFRWEGAVRDFLEQTRQDPGGASRELLARVAERGFTMSMD